jgi:DNA adenine methylase
MRTETKPFLRWAGGKQWLAKSVAPIMRKRLKGRYFEPFLGAGAMFFALSPKRALLSDLNWELINAFQMVAETPNRLLKEIAKIPVSSGTFYRIRSSKPRSRFQRAIRFIYLNRTCYGGLYRENRKGEFNTPYGGGSRTPSPLWECNLISEASKALSSKLIKLRVQDFSDSMKLAKEGDVIYCDPTYSSVTRGAFDRYGSIIFDWGDQESLAEEAQNAVSKGALAVISNTHCGEVKDLYRQGILIALKKNKAIGNQPKNSDNNKEYLIILDPEQNYEEWEEIGEGELGD